MCYTVPTKSRCPGCAGRVGLADSVDVQKTCPPGAKCPYRYRRPLPRRPREECVVAQRRCAGCVRRGNQDAAAAAAAAAAVDGGDGSSYSYALLPPGTPDTGSTITTTTTTTTYSGSTNSGTKTSTSISTSSGSARGLGGFAAMSREWEVRNGISPSWRLGQAYPEKENRGFWKEVFGARRSSRLPRAW